jgi:very-short-patch-repair endonuclease
VGELDGFSHDVQPDRDVGRDRWFIENGYRIMHFTNEDVLRDPEGVAMAVGVELSRLTHP